ncbi:zinc-finger homeodomain protein 1-like [Senna tora]|uniref:Zinc-finger homeodomain protein 1-like n=1 Tax=Senna tora TaxID=362788 RepID=A0A834WRG9_9FABA|nr:zinc-finger homeodomain protein 1-like [Senna tora]
MNSSEAEMELEEEIGGGGGMKMGEMMVVQGGRNSNSKARYKECLKNHAVSIGGLAHDGCGEFLPAGAEGTLDALKCAACNCHRNFHRKETDSLGEPYLLTHPQPHFSAYYRAAPAGYLQARLALPSTSGGGGTQSTREDQEDVSNPSGGGGDGSKKRFRTKFTQEQKDKMLALAERLGWRIQKHDEAVVQHFCNDTGVKRHVLKVWMHNNKHTLVIHFDGQRCMQLLSTISPATAINIMEDSDLKVDSDSTRIP